MKKIGIIVLCSSLAFGDVTYDTGYSQAQQQRAMITSAVVVAIVLAIWYWLDHKGGK